MKLTIIALALIASTYAQQPPAMECDKGCLACLPAQNTDIFDIFAPHTLKQQAKPPVCRSCMDAFVTDDGKCLRSVDTKSTQCLAFSKYNEFTVCQMCKPGYTIYHNFDQETNAGHESFCFPAEIEKCVLGYSNTPDKKVRCLLCRDGLPVADHTSCGGFTQAMGQGPESNCLMGVRDEKGNTGCWKCKDGFVNQKLKCVSGGTTGCLAAKDDINVCEVCNYFDGYYMNLPGKCKLMD